MKRGPAELSVEVEGGIVKLIARDKGRKTTLNLPPDLASSLAENIADAAMAALSQYLEHEK